MSLKNNMGIAALGLLFSGCFGDRMGQRCGGDCFDNAAPEAAAFANETCPPADPPMPEDPATASCDDLVRALAAKKTEQYCATDLLMVVTDRINGEGNPGTLVKEAQNLALPGLLESERKLYCPPLQRAVRECGARQNPSVMDFYNGLSCDSFDYRS